MKFKNDISMAMLLVFVGAVIGGSVAVGYNNHQLDEIRDNLDTEESNTVYINNTSQQTPLTHLFEQVEESVVAVNSFEGEQGQGSGFVYSEDGYIVTNYHVIEGSEEVDVTFTEGFTESAEVKGEDPYTDLAVLKVDSNDLEPVELGDLEGVNVGQEAIAIGNPFGFESSMTTGIISQRDRLLPVPGGFSIPNVLQTDAAINPGNSGGPLMNAEGEVIGVNTAIETQTGTFSGVGFAISVESVERVVPELIEEGSYQHSWLGVSGVDVNPEIADEMGLEENVGFLVVDVVEEGPAEGAIQESEEIVEMRGQEMAIGGDIIIGIDDQEIRGIDDILVYLARHTEAGDEIEVTVIRDGEEQTVEVTLDPRPEFTGQGNEE